LPRQVLLDVRRKIPENTNGYELYGVLAQVLLKDKDSSLKLEQTETTCSKSILGRA
jgi:hypothetical protein